jgi:hypothetical protein
MRTIEIPRDAWVEQLHAFTQAHQQWLVSLDVSTAEKTQTEIRNLPLLGVSVDRVGGDITIVVSAGSARAHVTHAIAAVVRIALRTTDEGADAALEIESRDATTTLRLRTAVLPETVDGIARVPPVGAATPRQ